MSLLKKKIILFKILFVSYRYNFSLSRYPRSKRNIIFNISLFHLALVNGSLSLSRFHRHTDLPHATRVVVSDERESLLFSLLLLLLATCVFSREKCGSRCFLEIHPPFTIRRCAIRKTFWCCSSGTSSRIDVKESAL